MKTKLSKYFEFMVEVLLTTAIWALAALAMFAIGAAIYLLVTETI